MKMYIVGVWNKYGPGYNDTVLEVFYVSRSLDKALEKVTSLDHRIFEAGDGTDYSDWDDITDKYAIAAAATRLVNGDYGPSGPTAEIDGQIVAKAYMGNKERRPTHASDRVLP